MGFGRNSFNWERKSTAAVVFSFLLIAESLAAVLILAIAASADPRFDIAIAIGVFAAIAMVPMWMLRRANRSPWETASSRRSWRQLFTDLLPVKRAQRVPRHTVWKRKRSNLKPEPFGSEYVSTFVPDRFRDPGPSRGSGSTPANWDSPAQPTEKP